MNTSPVPGQENPHSIQLDDPRRYWVWILALGLALVVLGVIALGCLLLVTEAYILYLGFLLIISGIFGAAQAVQLRRWSGFFLALLAGLLDVVIGFLMVTHPGDAAVIMTLLLAAFFFIGGLFRMVSSASLLFPGWGWSMLSGFVSVLLGVAIWRRWPWSSYWVIGLFIGIELLVRGWALVMFALAVRPPSPAGTATRDQTPALPTG